MKSEKRIKAMMKKLYAEGMSKDFSLQEQYAMNYAQLRALAWVLGGED